MASSEMPRYHLSFGAQPCEAPAGTATKSSCLWPLLSRCAWPPRWTGWTPQPASMALSRSPNSCSCSVPRRAE
eukprot:3232117-Lingulodinium_polyedra.AAC.1